MKRIKNSLLALLFIFPVVAMATNPTTFQEGKHYTVLSGLEPDKKPTVTELFSVYCPGCFMWESGPLTPLKEWLGANDIEFRQAHMSFMGNYARQATTALAMASGTPKYDAVKQALFNHLQVERKGDWRSDADFFATLDQAGLKESDYKSLQNSLPTMQTILGWNRYARMVNSVPAFIVNNRYLINMGSIKSHEELNNLITYLTNLPATSA